LITFVSAELEIDSSIKGGEGEDGGHLITPQEACSRIAEVVQEAVRKMEAVGEEKLRAYKRARMAVEACEREMEEKAREMVQLQAERQRQRQQVEELDSIFRLKQAEAEMFQLKANDARQVYLGI
jgi:Coiled-coil region of Oberon